MDLKNILAYQQVDSKLYELENELLQDPNKVKCAQLTQLAKTSQAKSNTLEEQAGSLLREMNELTKNYELTFKKGDELLKSNPENMTKQQIDDNLALKDKVSQNLTLLDKRYTHLAESINSILADFNRTVKSYNQAKEDYAKYKYLYDKKVAELEPKINELKNELAKMQKGIDAKIMQTYLSKRADKIFPVLVKLDGNNCGRCRMELSASAISKLKEEKILQCEHCRRIIYFE